MTNFFPGSEYKLFVQTHLAADILPACLHFTAHSCTNMVSFLQNGQIRNPLGPQNSEIIGVYYLKLSWVLYLSWCQCFLPTGCYKQTPAILQWQRPRTWWFYRWVMHQSYGQNYWLVKWQGQSSWWKSWRTYIYKNIIFHTDWQCLNPWISIWNVALTCCHIKVKYSLTAMLSWISLCNIIMTYNVHCQSNSSLKSYLVLLSFWF